ncbi:MAG: ribulose bisphosphate carboxylase small subunit [Firmicutes bacterium]|nr:ribulose bisphosphate carboxylase small subunit [Bacillota bacterium]
MAFHLTQGQFSFLPPLTDEEIAKQVQYAMDNGWSINLEFTDDPHPRNTYWEMWGLPMFDQKDPAAVLYEVNACRKAYPEHYIRLNAFDRTLGRQSIRLSFIVQRPTEDPGFGLDRQQGADREIRYTLKSYATEKPEGERFAAN